MLLCSWAMVQHIVDCSWRAPMNRCVNATLLFPYFDPLQRWVNMTFFMDVMLPQATSCERRGHLCVRWSPLMRAEWPRLRCAVCMSEIHSHGCMFCKQIVRNSASATNTIARVTLYWLLLWPCTSFCGHELLTFVWTTVCSHVPWLCVCGTVSYDCKRYVWGFHRTPIKWHTERCSSPTPTGSATRFYSCCDRGSLWRRPPTATGISWVTPNLRCHNHALTVSMPRTVEVLYKHSTSSVWLWVRKVPHPCFSQCTSRCCHTCTCAHQQMVRYVFTNRRLVLCSRTKVWLCVHEPTFWWCAYEQTFDSEPLKSSPWTIVWPTSHDQLLHCQKNCFWLRFSKEYSSQHFLIFSIWVITFSKRDSLLFFLVVKCRF